MPGGGRVRALGGRGGPSTQLENRVGEPLATPYLSMASQIQAGLDGISRKLTPGPSADSPYEISAVSLPKSLAEALTALDGSGCFRAAFGGVNRGARSRRQVDACMHVMAGTVGIERLEDQGRAAERLGHRSAGDYCGERQLFVAAHRRSAKRPDQPCGEAHSGPPQPAHHAARATTCCSPCSPVVRADSSLCAVFSAPPSAPGTLNTISNAASANRW